MTRLLFSLCFILLLQLCLAQGSNREADSLINLLNRKKANDSNRVKLLANLSYAITYEKPDSAMQYSDEALKIAEKIKWQKGIALSYRQKGLVYYVQSDNVKAIDWFQKALKAAGPLEDKLFEASVLNNIGNIYADLSQFDKALDYYNRLLTAARSAGSKKNELIALSNIGSVYTELNNFPASLKHYEQCLPLLKEAGNLNFDANIFNNIGRMQNKLGNHSKALHYYQQALHIANEVQNRNIQAVALNNTADVYLTLQEYSKAERYSRQSLQLSRAIGAIDWQANAWETLSNIYEKQHKNDSALSAYKQFITLRDSVINAENKSEITRKEMQHEQETKEALMNAEHAAEMQQQKTAKNFILLGGGLVLFSGLLLFFSYKRRRDAVAKRKDAELKAQIADTEMKVMRLQMNPHFIFNSLNSISDYIHKNNPQEADAYLSKFAKVMRQTLEHSEQRAIPLEEDLKTLELYMQLEAKRLQNKFTYEIRVSPEIDLENTLVPPLIFQPFVENSIWHGIAKKEGRGHIIINIKKEGEMLYCLIDDDGVGRQAQTGGEEAVNEKKSLGMKITKARIDILNKLNGTNATVQLTDKPQGVSAEVKLPLQLSF